MLFSSSIFLFGFLPLVLFLYYVIFKNKRIAQNVVLTLTSLLFYAWGEPRFVVIMIFSIFINWILGLWLNKHLDNKKMAKLIVALAAVANFSILYLFKYLSFTLTNINYLFDVNLTIPVIELPLGISFFTFQAFSYIVDVYRRDADAQRNPLNLALYISFFPQLIAGPIVRYKTIAEQINDRHESWDAFADGVCRFVVGLAKKVIIANNLALVAESAFGANAAGEELSVAAAWLGALAYTFQIYFDFSGYSDMAIGLGKMFGFQFLENFNYPYISKSISEFWRRWHMSLGGWFRDYVYFPLGGSRVSSKYRLVFNLFVVWMLTGFWHGANWTFIIWGFMYFVLITLEKLTGFENKIGWFGHVYTMLFVIIGWVFFNSANVADAISYLQSMFGFTAAGFFDETAQFYLSENLFFYISAALFSFPIAKWASEKFYKNKPLNVLYVIAVILILVVTITYLVKGSYNPFIYFNF